MKNDMDATKSYEELIAENEELSRKLEEAADTIDAIRSGQVDAIVVKDARSGHQLYTLKTADQTYRVFIEKMNEGAVTLNEDGIILYANSKFASMVDAPLSKVVGVPFEQFVTPRSLNLYREIFQNGWEDEIQMELTIQRNDAPIPCQLSVTTLQLDEGPSLSIIVTDLTLQKNIQNLLKDNNRRLKEINKELESSNHDLQQFASIASHDLQEPLRKILIFSTLLKNQHEQDLPPESSKHLQKIIASSLRMRNMILDILNYSRLSTGDGNFGDVDLREVIDEILDDYEILLTEKNVQVIMEDMPVIYANRAQIKQVFQNLISNSIKFAKENVAPIIRIFREESPDVSGSWFDQKDIASFCHVVVADNGIGFDSLYQDKIFSLFERLNNKDKYEGSGIGLAIAKKIMERHEGTITAESIPCEGARFTISLPFKQSVPVA